MAFLLRGNKMNEVKVNWPAYNAEKAQVLSQHKFALYNAKIKIGTVPVGKVGADGAPLNSPCWEWQAYRNKDGYGQFEFTNGKKGGAHRISAFLAGIVPSISSVSDDDQALHHCDNRGCVNPAHLYKGSDDDNRRDKMSKGRQAKGEENGQSKLTWNQAATIRKRYAAGNTTQQQLADEYGVTHSVISDIISNEGWFDSNYTPPTKRAQAPYVFLTAEQRAKVIKLYSQGGTTKLKLATQFGVSRTTIRNILKKGI